MADLEKDWAQAKPIEQAALQSAWNGGKATASQRDVRTAEPKEEPMVVKGLRAALGPSLEPPLAIGSGMLAAPIAGLAGLGNSFLSGQEAGAKTVGNVQQAMTYQPRSEGGKAVVDMAGKPFEALRKGGVALGQSLQDSGATPAQATYAQTAVEMIPSMFGVKGAAPVKSASTAAKESLNVVRDATYNAARSEGYVFPPSATAGGKLNAVVESAAGKTALNQEAILRNQQITNKIAARETGLPENKAITPGGLELRRQQLAEPYREAAAIDPAVASDVKALREARAEANRWYKYFESNPNPRIQDRANRLMERAETLEGYIDNAAQQAGKTDLLARLKQARMEIAKTYDVERALNLGTGDVSASTLSSLLDKGKPLSGGLETIAKAHQAFGPYMRDATSVANPGVGRSHGLMGVGAGPSGLHGGLGLWTSGIPALSGGARSLTLSDLYQNSVGRPSYPLQSQPESLAALLGSLQAQQK